MDIDYMAQILKEEIKSKDDKFNSGIDFLINDEQEAIDGYNKFLSSLSDKDYNKVIDKIDEIISDEKDHKAILKKMKR